jgi:hypothetical protein
MSGVAALASAAGQGGAGTASPEFYIWRQYQLRNGAQPRRIADYLQNAVIPALNRLGHKPVGVFEAMFGAPTPSVYVLTPFASLESMARVEAGLDRDQEFLKAGAAYLDAPAADPSYIRYESSLLAAFTKVPRIELPSATAANGPRIFELRTYESPSERAHRAKVRMFSDMGEIDIFRRVGLTPVFFARTVVGTRMPSLTYMLVHDNMAAREKSWDAFRNDAEWKKLSATPGYTDPDIVSNITTVFLRPAAYSQV